MIFFSYDTGDTLDKTGDSDNANYKYAEDDTKKDEFDVVTTWWQR